MTQSSSRFRDSVKGKSVTWEKHLFRTLSNSRAHSQVDVEERVSEQGDAEVQGHERRAQGEKDHGRDRKTGEQGKEQEDKGSYAAREYLQMGFKITTETIVSK